MGEEEKDVAKEVAPEGGDAGASGGAPDAGGMPGAFPTAGGGGRGVSISLKLIIIVTPIIVALIIGSIIWSYSLGKTKGMLKDGVVRKKTKFLGPVYPLSEIKTNIFSNPVELEQGNKEDTRKQKERIIELKINLVLNSDEAIDEINKRYPQLIDRLFFLVHKKSYDELDSTRDQIRFKRLIRDKFNAVLKGARIKEVYFEKFRIMPLKPVEVIKLEKKKTK